ncbi:MAG TPA: hypothetical protein VK168_14175 [Saprospiraceae bacterium]|nr:hypothetical protein [Saprospiraceae bacterium]
MNTKYYPALFFWLVCSILPFQVNAQADLALLKDLAEENKKSVEALVLYPVETRLAILEATRHPELLIKMQDMKLRTSQAFQTLIEDFPRSTQDVFYDLSRYPGLTERLVMHQQDARALRKDLELLPEFKREDAFGVATRQMATLIQIQQLDQTTNAAFARLMSGYTISTRKAFEHLLQMPEVVDLLNEDLRFTILVGETYRDNPGWVIQQMDSLNLVVARSHAEELDNWQKTIENDPAAQAELQAASREYAKENGYIRETSDDLYADEGYYSEEDEPAAVYHYYEPYPYWYGYPWWEPFPRWRPYPWWWDWGCQFYPGQVVVVYLPSYHFMDWYFGYPYHHVHYNHLSTHFVNHYYGHRRSGTTISTGVRDWHERNRTVISDDFLADKGRLPERLKDFGRFEQDWKTQSTRNPEKALTKEEFLDKNPKKYPDIQQSREKAATELQRESKIKREKETRWAPPKAPAKPEPAPANQQRPPRVQPSAPTPQPPTRKERPSRQTNPDTPDAAKDYHRQKWEQIKPAPSTKSGGLINKAPAQGRTGSKLPKTTKPKTGRN